MENKITPLNLQIGANYLFEYTNHRGETKTRNAQFQDLHYGIALPYYPSKTWMLYCFDNDKQAPRAFALGGINMATWRKL